MGYLTDNIRRMLELKDAEIAKLRAEVERLNAQIKVMQNIGTRMRDEHEVALLQICELREALDQAVIALNVQLGDICWVGRPEDDLKAYARQVRNKAQLLLGAVKRSQGSSNCNCADQKELAPCPVHGYERGKRKCECPHHEKAPHLKSCLCCGHSVGQ